MERQPRESQGTILAAAPLARSLVMIAWGGPKRKIIGILGANTLMGLALFLAAFPPSVWNLGVAAGLVLFSSPITNGCSQAIWQVKTAPDVQGRVFAVRRMIAWMSLPLAYILSGPLADRVFEPSLEEGGSLAGSVGRVIGVGDGRGIAFLYIILGVLILLAVLAAYLYPRLRQVEVELPDFVAAKEAIPPAE